MNFLQSFKTFQTEYDNLFIHLSQWL